MDLNFGYLKMYPKQELNRNFQNHLPFLLFAPAVGVRPGAVHRLHCASVHAATTAAKARCGLHDPITTTTGFKASFCAGHGSLPSVGQQRFDALLVRIRDDGHAAKATDSVRAHFNVDVVLVGELALGLAARGEAEAFFGPTVRLHFWHGCPR